MNHKVVLIAAAVCLSASMFGILITDGSHAETLSWTSGDCTCTLTDDGVFTVSGNGAMQNYTYMPSRPWHSNAQNITSVVVEDGVTAIGNYSFSDCYKIESVTIKGGPTIGQYAFCNCMALESADLGNATSIGHYSFQGCTHLARIGVPAAVTNIYASAFQGCTQVQQVFFEAQSWNITLASQCFSMGTQSDSVIAMVFSPNNMANGRLASYAGSYTTFRYASLEESWVSGDTTCTLNVSTGVFTVSGNGAMQNYTDYTDVPWAQFKPYITQVVIENGVTSIGDYSFRQSINLESASISNSVTYIGISAFNGCSSIATLTIPDSVTSIGQYAFRQCNSLTSASIGNGVTTIPNSAFNGCTSLKSISLPNGLTTIEQGAFYLCTSLESLTIPDSVTTIKNSTFYHCTSLTSLKLGSHVVSIGTEAFRDCSALAMLTIPNSVTTIGERAFQNCTSLSEVEFGTGIDIISQQAFEGCYVLSAIVFQATEWNVTTIGSNAFGLGTEANPTTAIVYSRGNIAVNKLDGRINEHTVIYYHDLPNVAVRITVNNEEWGSVNISKVLVERGTQINLEGNTLHIATFDIVATPHERTAQYTFAFGGWTGIPLDGRAVQDLTITANFTATVNQYTVTINVNNPDYGSVDVATVVVDYGTAITMSGNILTIGTTNITATPGQGTPQYSYVFDGWAGAPDSVTGDTAITANFSMHTNAYTITYSGNGGTPETLTLTYEWGTSADLSMTCTRAGYDFLGWNTTDSATEPLTEYVVTGDATLYAVWTVHVSPVIPVNEYIGNITHTEYQSSGYERYISLIPLFLALGLIISIVSYVGLVRYD